MTGVEILNTILEHIKNNNSTWDAVLNSVPDWKVLEIPDERHLNIETATISWSSKFDFIFTNGFNSSPFTYIKVNKAPCSSSISHPIDFIIGSTKVACLFPNCLDWLDNEDSISFFINNIQSLINFDLVTSNIYLDDIINNQAVLCFNQQYEDDVIYTALKLGYVTKLSTPIEWYQEPLTHPNTCLVKNVVQSELREIFNIAMQTEDLFYQYIEFYHIIEYKYYEALYQKLAQLKSQSSKKFFDELKYKRISFTELQMFEYVFEEIATGFSEILDVPGIKGCSTPAIINGVTKTYTELEVKFMSDCNRLSLSISNKKSWCDFLYQLRCGIVHSKEGEEAFERTPANESLLTNYILPFMMKLAIYLIEH